MPTEPATTEQEQPQPQGLPSRTGPTKREPRTGRDLIDAAADGAGLSPEESEDLLAYYLENGELPGDGDPLDVAVELGHGSHARKLACTVKPISWSEWQDGQDRATSTDGQKFDTFMACSYHVARALVKPQLGPIVVRQQQEAKNSEDGLIDGPKGKRVKAPEDAAMLLRRMFAGQSGALLDLSAKVVEISKLGASQQAVSEIEAAKN